MPIDFEVRGKTLSREQVEALEGDGYRTRYMSYMLCLYETHTDYQALHAWGDTIGLNDTMTINWSEPIEDDPERWHPPGKVAAVLERLRQALLDGDPNAVKWTELWVYDAYRQDDADGYFRLSVAEDMRECIAHIRRLEEHGETLITFEAFN